MIPFDYLQFNISDDFTVYIKYRDNSQLTVSLDQDELDMIKDAVVYAEGEAPPFSALNFKASDPRPSDHSGQWKIRGISIRKME